MSKINQPKNAVDAEVERLFKEHPPIKGEVCTNPVMGTTYLGGVDPIGPQKQDARARLLAREEYGLNVPADAPPFPLSYAEREDHRRMGRVHTISALYAGSLESLGNDRKSHPSYHDYACGVMASEHNGYTSLKEDAELLKRFPPRQLPGLGPDLCWRPPALHAEVMASYARARARAA
jgi:hypothetical protein